jgi:hypothetical protein
MNHEFLMSNDRCDRCFQIMSARIMSFFTEDLICMECLRQEGRLLAALRENQVDVSALANCGYLPVVEQFAHTVPVPPLAP